MTKRFPDATADDMKKTDREGATNADPALDITRTQEVQAMPVEAHISPIGDSASNQNSWRSIGDLARALAEKAAGK